MNDIIVSTNFIETKCIVNVTREMNDIGNKDYLCKMSNN